MWDFPLGDALVLALLGLATGAYGTLVGLGGGFVVVPLLLLVYHFTPQQAAGTSLALVFFNALSGTVAYARQKRVDYRTGVKFALATLPGAVLGAYLSTYLTSAIFKAVFGLLLLAAAASLILRPQVDPKVSSEETPDPPPPSSHVARTIVDAQGEVFHYAFNERLGLLLSFFVGFISSVLGIGGGIIHVPALIYLFAFPTHIATATSHFILVITSLAGTSSHLAFGHVVYIAALSLGAGAVVGAQAGAALSRRLHGKWIVRILALALVFMGLRLLWGLRG